MDALNQDHDKEREHLANELSDVRHKLQLYVLVIQLTLSDLANDIEWPWWLWVTVPLTLSCISCDIDSAC